MTLSKSEATIIAGETDTITATTVPSDAEVTWASGDDNVATVADGVITAVAAGTTNITATITVDGTDYTGTCAVTVSAPTPSVTLSKDTETVAVSSTVTLTATTVPDGETVTWESDDTDVATVNDGVVTGVAAGTATITATITVDGTDYTDTCDVTVTA